jgi:hypothetical protein
MLTYASVTQPSVGLPIPSHRLAAQLLCKIATSDLQHDNRKVTFVLVELGNPHDMAVFELFGYLEFVSHTQQLAFTILA